MAYTVIPDSDVDVDSPFDADLASALRNNIRELRMQLFAYSKAETSTTTTTFATLDSFQLYIPSITTETGWTRSIALEVDGKNTSTSQTTTFRIVDNATSTAGTEVTTSSSTYVSLTSSLTVTDSWIGTTRTINLQYKTSSASSTASIKSVSRITGRLYY